jgi:predicted anti-sigma-YlaC factor YlaD
MRCGLCRHLLARSLDGGNTTPAWVERHAAQCRACGEWWVDVRRAHVALGHCQLPLAASASPELRHRILRAVRSECAPDTTPLLASAWSWGAVAAVALIVVGMAWGVRHAFFFSRPPVDPQVQAMASEVLGVGTVLKEISTTLAQTADSALMCETAALDGDLRAAAGFVMTCLFIPSCMPASDP